jgi:thiamine-monophosphate kinase
VRRLSEVGEIAFLDGLRRLRVADRDVEVGIGDDCAVVRAGRGRWLLTTDALVEDVHFRWRWQTPRMLGRRAFAVNASDIAAMAGAPRFALLSIALPRGASVKDLWNVVAGFASAAREVDCALVGGNLSASREWMISVTLIGEASGVGVTRSGGRPGDLVYVTGTLGAAAFGREILLGRRRGPRRAIGAFLDPRARLDAAAVLARTRAATAAIDVSDGLLSDLRHLCKASGVGASIDADRLPLSNDVRRLAPQEHFRLALSGGEDYELLFTVSPRRRRELENAARAARVAVTAIGRLTRRRGIAVSGVTSASALRRAGHDHFRAR